MNVRFRITATNSVDGSAGITRGEDFTPEDVSFLRQHLRKQDMDERDPFKMRAFRKLADLLEGR